MPAVKTKKLFVDVQRLIIKKKHNKLNCLKTRNQNKTKIQPYNYMNKINLYKYTKARIYKICSANKECRRPKKSV